MNDWKDKLYIKHGGLTAEVILSSFPAPTPVQICFLDATELIPEAEAAADSLLRRLPELKSLIVDIAFEHYQQLRSDIGYENLPSVIDAVALRSLYQLERIYIPNEVKEGKFGLGFECEWDEEHGFGIQFRNWEVTEVGGDADAFSFYD